jgi:hypothetical protein
MLSTEHLVLRELYLQYKLRKGHSMLNTCSKQRLAVTLVFKLIAMIEIIPKKRAVIFTLPTKKVQRP